MFHWRYIWDKVYVLLYYINHHTALASLNATHIIQPNVPSWTSTHLLIYILHSYPQSLCVARLLIANISLSTHTRRVSSKPSRSNSSFHESNNGSQEETNDFNFLAIILSYSSFNSSTSIPFFCVFIVQCNITRHVRHRNQHFLELYKPTNLPSKRL